MGIIVPENQEVKHYKGIHLFHYAMSNCSQRVRIALAEKGLAWISHHLDLAKNEHATAWYQSINPNGVVPTLVHNGTVIIESIDIIKYIDETFPGPAFVPKEAKDQALMRQCLKLADEIQPSLKILSHEFLFKLMAKQRAKQLSSFMQNHQDAQLIAFHQEFASAQGLSQDKIMSAVQSMHADFAQLNEGLSHASWLAGQEFSLADIAWMVNVHRMSLMNFPLEHYPYLKKWYQKIKERPSFKSALEAYEPRLMRWFFRLYSQIRYFFGTDISQKWS